MRSKIRGTMAYEKRERKIPYCLECGDSIHYGRTDKKFCCDECRVRYYNHRNRESRTYKRKVLSFLTKNYEILSELLEEGVQSVAMVELLNMGFLPGMMTSHIHSRGKEECACFDIKYTMTTTRVYSIGKLKNVSLTLPSIENIKTLK